MNDFKKNYKRQMQIFSFISGLCFGMLIVLVLKQINVVKTGAEVGYQEGTQIGMLAGFGMVGLIRSQKMNHVLKNEQQLLEKKIEHEDERLKMINEKAAYLSSNIELVVLTVAMFITSFIDSTISSVIQVIVLAIIAIKIGVYQYLKRKY